MRKIYFLLIFSIISFSSILPAKSIEPEFPTNTYPTLPVNLSGEVTYCVGTFGNQNARVFVKPDDGGGTIGSNGVWNDLNGGSRIRTLGDGRIDVRDMPVGDWDFTYTSGTRFGTLKITIVPRTEAGKQNTIPGICTGAGVQSLIGQLTGAVSGGSWAAGNNPAGGIFDAAAGTFNPAGASTGFYTFFNTSPTPAGALGSCTNNAKVELFVGGPRVVAGALSPSCTNNVPNNDGLVQISVATGGDRYLLSAPNSPVTGNYASATSFGAATFPLTIASNLANPSGSVTYNIRVFGGSDACFTDATVILKEQTDCKFTCSSTDFLYLNDEDLGIVHKFEVNSADGSVKEIGKPWFNGKTIGNDLRPHGIAADLNGFLYIAQRSRDNNSIMKLTCDGTLIAAEAISNPISQIFNMGSLGNKLYIGNQQSERITSFDLCTGTNAGSVFAAGATAQVDFWGYYQDDTNWYVGETTTNAVYSGLLDSTLFTNPTTQSGAKLFDLQGSAADPTPTTTIRPMGLTRDTEGNFYIIVNQDFGGASQSVTIQKYTSGGTFVKEIISGGNQGINLNDGEAGFFGARGIVYSNMSKKLYVGGKENCVVVFDTELNELVTLNIGNPGDGKPKGMGILTESCPMNNNVVIDTILCNAKVNDRIFLQDLIDCPGVICGGFWKPVGTNTGLTFNECDLSITVNSLDACGSFMLESDGVGRNPTCGVYRIMVNVEVGNITGNTVSGDQTICAGEQPNTLTASPTSGSGTLVYQWQQSTTSCTEGFTDISGANSATYAPPALSTTTFYKLISMVNGNCTSEMCADTSNCVTITVNPNPTITTAIPICNVAGTEFEVSYTATSGATLTADKGTVDMANNKITGVTSGETVTITATLNGCITTTTATQNCTVPCTPPTPTTADVPRCGEGSVDLMASGCTTGFTATWFTDAVLNAAALGTNTGDTYTTPSVATDTEYFVACVDDNDANCKSAGASASVIITAQPTSDNAVVVQATCNAAGTAANDDASITISNITDGASYSFTTNGTAPAFGSAVAVVNNEISLKAIPNPASSVTYTFRIYNAETCFLEVTATLNPTVCTPVCVTPNAGDDFVICLPKTTLDLTDAPAGTEWVAESGNTATIDATTGVITGMTATGVYTFRLQKTGDATCSDVMTVTVTNGEAPNVLCNDGSTSVTLEAPANLTNVKWYSMDGTEVGAGNSLIVTSNTGGLADGTEAYYYIGEDGTASGCAVELCCPVKFLTQDCCPTPNCAGVTVIKN